MSKGNSHIEIIPGNATFNTENYPQEFEIISNDYQHC